jgi:hypothetical protein
MRRASEALDVAAGRPEKREGHGAGLKRMVRDSLYEGGGAGSKFRRLRRLQRLKGKGNSKGKSPISAKGRQIWDTRHHLTVGRGGMIYHRGL